MKRAFRVPVLFAAFVIVLSTTAGVAAQTSTTLPVGVTLDRTQMCQMTFAVNGTFGSWVWNEIAGQYMYDPASNSGLDQSEVQVLGEIVSMPDGGCDITVTFDGLTGTGGTIDITNFSAFSYWKLYQNEDPDVDPAMWTHQNVTGQPFDGGILAYDWSLTLETVPVTLEPGAYTGEIGITYSNSQ